MWRVESRVPGRTWRANGIKESNYEFASKWWAELGKQWNREFRLIKES